MAAGAVDNRHQGEWGRNRSQLLLKAQEAQNGGSQGNQGLVSRHRVLYSLCLAGSVIAGEAQLTKADVNESSLVFDSIYARAVPVVLVYPASLTTRVMPELRYLIMLHFYLFTSQFGDLNVGREISK